VTLARVLIARHHTDGATRHLDDAAALLERLTAAAQAGGRTGAVIETLLLQALTRQALGDVASALATLEQALTLADAEGYLHIFLDERHRIRDLLRQAAARGIAGDYTRRVLSAFDGPVRRAPVAMTDPTPVSDPDGNQILTAR